jgi:hypothetical protein
VAWKCDGFGEILRDRVIGINIPVGEVVINRAIMHIECTIKAYPPKDGDAKPPV